MVTDSDVNSALRESRRIPFVLLAGLVMFVDLFNPDRAAFAATNQKDPSDDAPLTLSLNGVHRFLIGDDPSFSEPDFDDRSWRSVSLPGAWRESGLGELGDVGWYRLRFNWTANRDRDDWYVSLGYVGNVSEAFLNGVWLGRIGGFDPIAVPAGRTLHAYPLPRDLLRKTGENVLAVRVGNFVGSGGILSGPIGMGSAAEVLIWQRDVRQSRFVVTCVVALLTVGLLLGIGIFWFRARRPGWEGWACLFLASMAITYVAAVWATHPISPPDWFFRRSWALAVFAAFSYTMMVARFCLISNTVVLGALLTMAAFLAPLVWLYGGTPDWYRFLSDTTGLYFLMCMGTSLVCCWRAIRDRRLYARILTFGVVTLYLGSVIDALTGSFYLYDFASSPVAAWELGLFLALPLHGYVFVAQVLADRDRLWLLGRQVLKEREAERRRLAQDLHDGLGQSLQALKVMLQLGQERSGTADRSSVLGDPVEHLSTCIRELRLLAREMYPGVSREVGFIQLLEAYAGEVSNQHGVDVEVVAGDRAIGSDWKEDLTAHSYLIFKEAIGNAIRHGGASRVIVRVAQRGWKIELSIEDDGLGFDVASTVATNQGVGIRSIQDRVALFGGTCQLTSSVGKGTRLAISLIVESD